MPERLNAEGDPLSSGELCRITAIEPQRRHPERVSIFVDGTFALGVDGSVAVSLGLRVGQSIDLRQLQELARAEELRQALDLSLRFLGYRSRSRDEVRRRLARKGYEEETIDQVIGRLSQDGLVDDSQFAEAWVRARTSGRMMGPRRIAWELRQKGVDAETVRAAIGRIDEETELGLALQVGRQKAESVRGEPMPVVRRKVAAALQRRGFSWEVTARVLDTILAPGKEEEISDE
jgi:regulatory protein